MSPMLTKLPNWRRSLTVADVDAVIHYARTYPARVAEDRLGYERSLASADAG